MNSSPGSPTWRANFRLLMISLPRGMNLPSEWRKRSRGGRNYPKKLPKFSRRQSIFATEISKNSRVYNKR
jgi:hypothetical protein